MTSHFGELETWPIRLIGLEIYTVYNTSANRKSTETLPEYAANGAEFST